MFPARFRACVDSELPNGFLRCRTTQLKPSTTIFVRCATALEVALEMLAVGVDTVGVEDGETVVVSTDASRRAC